MALASRQRTRHGGEADMKVYEGKRAFDGLVVTVDGKPLPEHY